MAFPKRLLLLMLCSLCLPFPGKKTLQPNFSMVSAPEKLALKVLGRRDGNIRGASQNCSSTTLPLQDLLLPCSWWLTAQCWYTEHCSYVLLQPVMFYSFSHTHSYPTFIRAKMFYISLEDWGLFLKCLQ